MQTSTESKPARTEAPTYTNGTAAHAEEAPKKSSKRPLIMLGIVVIGMLAAMGGYALYTANQENTDDAQIEADVVPLGARVGGLVLHVKVQDNQHVKKGDVIVELDRADYAAHVKEAQANLATAQAQAAAADAQAQVVAATAKGGFSSAKAMVSGSSVAVASAGAQIASAQASLARVQAEAKKADLDLGRAKELFAANAVPKQMLDNAQAAHDASQAALAAAQAQVSAADEGKRAAQSRVAEAQGRLDQSSPFEAQIAAAQANAALAHAHVESAQAALTLAQNQLSYTTVTAPDDGQVSKLSVHEGQLVQPGQPLVELVPSETYVVANFKETQLGRIKPGQKVEITIDAYPGKTLEGKVQSLSGGTGSRFALLPADNASGNFVKVVQRVPVRIAWVNPPQDLPLRAGLSTDVTVFVK